MFARKRVRTWPRLFSFMPNRSVQAADTFTNVAYVAAGLYVLLELLQPYHVAMAAALFFLGLVSGLFHATSARLAQSLDEIGMYAVLSVLFWAAVAGTFVVDGIYLIMVASWLVLTAFHRELDSHKWVPGIAVATFLVIMLLGSKLLGLVAVGLFILAWLANQHISDYGHAIWHVLTAAALTVAFAAV